MGRAIAAQLGREGAHVVAADRESAPKSIWPGDEEWAGLAAVVGEIEGWGGRGLAVTADVSVAADVEAMVARTVDEFGKLDILVHCVGVRGPVPVPVVDLDEATWRMLLDVNLTGAFLTAKASAKAMLADPAGAAGKKIILVSLAPYKINVNAINPGAFETNFRDDSLLKQAKDRGLTVEESLRNPPAGPTGQAGPPPIPLGRLGTPHDIADLVSFLVSDRASYITGEDINLSGGAS
jgi:NAD(P)-dependent dehydrogenase (short-subunit alcohol dehydrogenase family)